MSPDILDDAVHLRGSGQPFALATVVAVQPPTSATPGARAIVMPDGALKGWIGGGCAQPTVVRQSLEALAEGTPRLVVISPEPSTAAKPGVKEVRMTCASQGELQIYVEPFLPRAQLVVVGISPVAQTLAKLGALLDFEVCACDPEADRSVFPDAHAVVNELEGLVSRLTERSLVVVATIGQYDEDAVSRALASAAGYVGLVASEKRTATVLDYLRGQGFSPEQLAHLRRPSGLAAKTVMPAEIAFSIMAELLEVRRQKRPAKLELPAVEATAIDPICQMTVEIATARYKTQRDGQTYYFCCPGCLAKFEQS